MRCHRYARRIDCARKCAMSAPQLRHNCAAYGKGSGSAIFFFSQCAITPSRSPHCLMSLRPLTGPIPLMLSQ